MLRIGKCKHQIVSLISGAATLFSFSVSAFAQNIATDGTTGEIQTLTGSQYNIPQSLGTKADKNLFHSFGKFNLDAGESAVFQSGADISNIFSRVTGGTPSSINGLISTSSSSVNLFFINPSGIIFGENASLNVGGSFAATTLDSLVWNDGSQFSAINPKGRNSLLKIAGDPTGFVSQLMQPRPVIIAGSRLQASEGNNLLFLGGSVNLDRSSLTLFGTQGGKIELAGISESETVGLEFSGNQVGLSFSEDVKFADISLSNGSGIVVAVEDKGEVKINARNLDILSGSSITTVNTSSININTSDTVTIDGVNSNGSISSVGSFALAGFVGKGGDININTGLLSITNGGILQNAAEGPGDAGSININVQDNVTVDGVGNRFNSQIVTLNNPLEGGGKGGEININTGSLNIANGANVLTIATQTNESDKVAGININANNTVVIDGEGITFPSPGESTRLTSKIQTIILNSGKAGDIKIAADSFKVTNGGNVSTSTSGEGDTGNITINARDSVILDGKDSGGIPSGVESFAGLNTQGDAGNIIISTGSLSLTNGTRLTSSTSGKGNAGNITINARDDINITNSRVLSNLEITGDGKAGDIDIFTDSLLLKDGAQLSSSTSSKGDAGSISINARDRVIFDGENKDGLSSGVFTSVQANAFGNAGDISISTSSLSVNNGAQLSSSTFSKGNAGDITINARDRVIFDGEGKDGLNSAAATSVESSALGKGGNISINTGSLSFTNGAQLNSATRGRGDAGDININAGDQITFDGEDKDSFASGAFTLVESNALGKAGDISVSTGSLSLTSGAQLNSTTRGKGDAGDITINADNNIAFDGEDEDGFPSGVLSNVQSTAMGDAGNINISAGGSLFVRNRAAISANSRGEGNTSNIFITVGEALEANNGNIRTDAQTFSGGRINITAKQIRLFGDSNIRTNVASGIGGGGNIILTSDTIIALDDSDILSFARDGKGGDITFNTEGFFSSSQFFSDSAIMNPDDLDLNNRVDVNASGTISGNITGIPDTTFIQNSLRELPANQIDTNALISQSCIVRNNDTGSTFNITGSSGFPHSPGNSDISSYPTNQVRSIPDITSGEWKKGDPIIEPDGVYRLPDGRLALIQKCR